MVDFDKTKLRKYIDQKGSFNKSKLIEISGYSRGTFYSILNGNSVAPEDFKKRLSDHIGVQINQLF